MEQEGHVRANKRRKIQKEEMIKYNPVDKSVCSSVVDLTDDAWLLVFSYLATADRIRIARVCTRWRELARISWKSNTRLSFENMTMATTNYHLEFCLQQCGTRLQCLNLTHASGYRITPHFLVLVGLHSASLQELNFFDYCFLDNTILKTLAEKLPRLRSLSLSHCCNVDDDGLRPALKMLTSLKSLNVTRNPRITGEFFSQAPPSLTEVLAKCCHKLTDKGIRFLAERCKNLEAIDISGTRDITGYSIRHLAEHCPKLKRVKNFSVCMEWDESTFVTLFKLPLLEELHVPTGQLFCELSRHCPRLTAISLYRCRNLTDANFSHVCSLLHLESIDLSYCDQITDRGLIQLSSAHSQLKKVCLSCCQGITDEGVGHLVSDHPNLLELNITSCCRVTDRVLPMLELGLQRREHTQPLEIWALATSILSEKADAFRKNTRCIVYGK